jgi:predicted RNase H-like nuclease (RuvC/YqgF family)
MRTHEDPCRDPASEARDDHASESMTPETDALVPSQGRIRTMREYIEELEAHARRLERQRDELMEIANRAVSALDGNLRCEETCKCSGRHQISELQSAIAAVKGGTP